MNSICVNSEYSVQDEHLSDFCRAIGVRCFSTGDLFWSSYGLRLFSPLPAYRQISLSPKDLSYIWKQGALFIHYFTSDDCPFYPGYDLIVEDKNYDFDNIQSAKRRHNIRWALKHCNVERVPFELLLKIGLPLVEETYNRLSLRFNGSVLERWKNYFRAAVSNPMFQAWGVFVLNQLAAFNFHIYCRDGAYIPMIFSRTDLLKWHPVDALVFVSTQHAMARDGVAHISYGRRPLTGVDTDSLVNFKESMGYKKIPLKERLEVNPVVKPVFSRPLSSATKALADLFYHRSGYARIVSGVISTLRGQIKLSDAGYGG